MPRGRDYIEIDDRDLRDLVRRTSTLSKGMRGYVSGPIRDAATRTSQAIVQRAEARTAMSSTRQDDLFRGRTKVYRDRFVKARVNIGGYHAGRETGWTSTNSKGVSRGRRQGVPLPLLFWGAEFGNHAAPLTFTRPRNSQGYSYYAAVRDVWRGQAGEEYRRAVYEMLVEAELV
jgi:hypothetical protein